MRLPARIACYRHRAALVAFVDRREEGRGTPAALAHLDRCTGCRAELQSIALAIIALHRLAFDLDRMAPPAAAAAPVVLRRSRLRVPRVTLAGPVLATAIAAVLLFPAFGLYRHVVPQSDARSAVETGSHSRQLSAEYLPAKSTGSAQFWTYGTYGLTAQVLWPPSGPSRLFADPERSRFDLRAAGRTPGAWVNSVERVQTGVVQAFGVPAVGPVNADSI